MAKVVSSEEALKTANSLFVDDNFEEALINYDLSIELDNNNIDAFLKRSQCHTKLENYTDAIADANKVIALQPSNAKGYLRKGIACFELEEYETALAAFEKGASLDSSDSSFKTWIRKCKAEIESEGGEVPQATPQKAPEPTPAPPSSSSSSSSSPSSSSSSSATTSTPTSTSSSSSSPSSSSTPSTTTSSTPSSTPSSSSSSTPSSSTPAPASSAPKIRHEWFQNATHVIVTVFAKGVKNDDLSVDIQTDSLSVSVKLTADNLFVLDLDLSDSIIPSESKFTLMSTKIEISLKKSAPVKWTTLERSETSRTRPWDTPAPSAPPANKQKKNWDKIATEEIGADKLEGDEGLNKVFQDIYSNASEEQRRAMIKSFTESGGTVLSTNWQDVGKGEVKGSPPKGMEMKEWGKQ